VDDVLRLRAAGAEVIDVRPSAAYAAGHVPRSLAIPLRGVFATWLGWLVKDPATSLVFVLSADQDVEEIVWQARKVGYDNLAGRLDVAAWTSAGQPVATVPLVDAENVNPARVVDVRQTNEYASGHLPAAVNVELGALADTDLPAGPVVTMCEHGERATTAASVLERTGHGGVAVLRGGPQEWAKVTGIALEAPM
jgi:hydroxyacylglutathione hydrolase